MTSAFAFLTIFGRGSPPDDRTLNWFPLVGALIGLAVGGTWWAAIQTFDPLMAAVLVVAVDVAVTGMLHLDGLADSADGLLPHLTRERRLAVMTEPTLGAFAAVTVAVVLLLRVAGFLRAPGAVTGTDVAAMVGIWCASRSCMALAARTMTYARNEGGLATAFTGGGSATASAATTTDTDGRRRRRGALASSGTGIAAGCAVLVWSGGLAGLAGAVALLAGAAGVASLAQRRLAGFTGDVLGGMGVVAETAALVVLAARW